MKKWLRQFTSEDWIIVFAGAVILALAIAFPSVMPQMPKTLATGADWLSVSGNVISGTPTETGPYDVTVTIHKDGGYTDDTQSFRITVYSKAGFVSEPGADGFYTYMLD